MSTLRVAAPLGVPYAGTIPPSFDPALHESSADGLGGSPNRAGGDRAAAWVYRQIGAYEAQYCQMKDLGVVAVTFNVGCKRPPSMRFMLGPGVDSPRDPRAPDLIVVGLQEVDMSASALIREETEASVPWVQAVSAALEISNHGGPYQIVVQRQLVGLMLIVCCRNDALGNLSHVRVATIATGAMGTIGNKGAVGFRCTYRLSSLCFLVCHLAAHQNAVKKRNQDIAQILSSLNFAAGPGAATDSMLLPQTHDICVVLGDLNYRVDLPYEAATELCRKRDVASLLKEDQLLRELAQVHTPWAGFTDFRPTFLPTYRFDIGTDNYDTSEKRRIPSYTDRILYQAKDVAHRVELVALDARMDVRSSDHKPVIARLNVPVKEADAAKKAVVTDRLAEVVRTHGVDKASTAVVSLSKQTIHFGDISYLDAAQDVVEITNNGLCVAEVHLARRHHDDRSDSTWLRVAPCSLNILPGKSAKVTVAAVADWASLRWTVAEAPYQSARAVDVTSFLMICVRGGPALCVVCECRLVYGAMANTLDNMAAAGALPVGAAYAAPAADQPPPPTTPGVVKEIWYLVDALSSGDGPRTPELFLDATPDASQMRSIVQHLETKAEPFTVDSLGVTYDAVAATLLLLLRDLQIAVVPPPHHLAAIQAGRSGATSAAVMAVLRALPPNHHNTLVYLVSFGRFLLKPANSCKNGLTTDQLATAWAPAIFALSQATRAPAAPPAAPPTGGQPVEGPSTSMTFNFAQQQPSGGWSDVGGAAPAGTPSSSSAPPSSSLGVPGGGGAPTSPAAGMLDGGSGNVTPSARHDSVSEGAVPDAMSARKEFEAEMECAVRWLSALLAGRPELHG